MREYIKFFTNKAINMTDLPTWHREALSNRLLRTDLPILQPRFTFQRSREIFADVGLYYGGGDPFDPDSLDLPLDEGSSHFNHFIPITTTSQLTHEPNIMFALVTPDRKRKSICDDKFVEEPRVGQLDAEERCDLDVCWTPKIKESSSTSSSNSRRLQIPPPPPHRRVSELLTVSEADVQSGLILLPELS